MMSLPRSLQPYLPIPEPLKGSETGSFAHRSIAVRLPEIGRRTIHENQFPQPVAENLQTLIDQLPFGAVRPLIDASAPDSAAWQHYIASYLGLNWLEVPWFFAENYFYRRILEAT
ncbi:MAG: protein-glutamate O-methyltransferase family protein, partial [Omnitrophica WOR_2 bacterium]